jgi:hypothetical protein
VDREFWIPQWEVIVVGDLRPRKGRFQEQALRWAQNLSKEHGQALVRGPNNLEILYMDGVEKQRRLSSSK